MASEYTRSQANAARTFVYSLCKAFAFEKYSHSVRKHLDWLQSLKQFFINVSLHILVASLTVRMVYEMMHG